MLLFRFNLAVDIVFITHQKPATRSHIAEIYDKIPSEMFASTKSAAKSLLKYIVFSIYLFTILEILSQMSMFALPKSTTKSLEEYSLHQNLRYCVASLCSLRFGID